MTGIGLLGVGHVGSALARLIARRPELELRVTRALVRDLHQPREVTVPITTDPADVLSADLLVEVMGGTTLAGELMLRALAAGKRVVTANKAALAERWDEFAPYLAQGRLYCEAAVMAGTPVIGPLTGALRGSQPLELHATLNGTCAYILGQLEAGVSYAEALAEAQRLGYAEADPTLDVTGLDAAHKLTILARLAFDPAISWESVKAATRGITHLSPKVVQSALAEGKRVRLVGSIWPEHGAWRAAVRPLALPLAHPLANATSARNGLLFVGDAVGEVFIAGAGAGANPTASAVLADIIAAATGQPGPAPLRQAAPVPNEPPTKPAFEVL